jgi:hypothetical protein
MNSLEHTLQKFLEDQIGSKDAFISTYNSDIFCGLENNRKIKKDSKSAEYAKMEFTEMAHDLINLLDKWPFHLTYELTSVSHNGFCISPFLE